MNDEQKEYFDKAAKLEAEAIAFEKKGDYKSACIRYSDIFPLFDRGDIFPSLFDTDVKNILIKTLESRGKVKQKLSESAESDNAKTALLEESKKDFCIATSFRTSIAETSSLRRCLFNV